MIDSHLLNTFDLVRHRNIIVSDNAMKDIVVRLADNDE
jgi:hypothetical protein